MKRIYIVLLSVVAIAAVGISVALSVTADGSPEQAAATSVPHFRTADVRIEITEDALVSRNQDPVYVQLDSGVIPDEVTHLTVLTDENCTPDAEGVSHCLNRVEYETPSGTQGAALRHHHKMSEEPCLTPGQTLEIVRTDG